MTSTENARRLELIAEPGGERGPIDRVAAERAAAELRGVQKFGAKTVTSTLHGLVRDDPRTRQEFLALTTRNDS
jgi:GTP cyclohydrolase I